MVDTSKLGVELEAEVGKTLHVHGAIRFEEVPLNAALGADLNLRSPIVFTVS